MASNARRHQATWDDIASLDADFIARWGAFKGYIGPVDFEGLKPDKIHFEHDADSDKVSVFYMWPDNRDDDAGPTRSVVQLERRPCRFGGSRVYYRCPRCTRRTLRLAVLPKGLCCGTCGRITWGSRRETDTRRLIRRANRIAARLGQNSWTEPPKRPPYMHAETYARLMAEREPIVSEINQRVATRMARAKGPLGAWGALARWGL